MKNQLCVVAVLVIALASAREAAAQVAKFRVTDVKQSGDTATVTIAWEYSSNGTSSPTPSINGGNNGYSGKGVKLYLHNTAVPPGYGNAEKGTPVGTVDMTNGTGTHSFKIDTKALKLNPGQSLVLTGVWPNNHRWGVDDSRPGGQFKLPAKATGLRGITPIKANTPARMPLGTMSTRTKSSKPVRASAGRRR